MKLINIVKQLSKKGYNITFYKRKDGGILVKTINGKSFTGATGNLRLRGIAGEKVFTKQVKANRLIAQKYVRKVPKSIMKMDINKLHGEKLFKRVHREWKEALKKGFKGYDLKLQKGTTLTGRITWKKYEWALEHLSPVEAEMRLRENYRYIKGLAYTKNIEHLQDYFRNTKAFNIEEAKRMEKIDKWLSKNGDKKLTESAFQEIVELRYDYEKGEIDFDEFIDSVEEILSAL